MIGYCGFLGYNPLANVSTTSWDIQVRPILVPYPTRYLLPALATLSGRVNLQKVDWKYIRHQLGGGNSNIFYFHPENWGRWNQFDDHIFQRGWFNHQLVNLCQDQCKAENSSNQSVGLKKWCNFLQVELDDNSKATPRKFNIAPENIPS